MTATDNRPIEVPEDSDRWRGRVKDSQVDDLPIDEKLPRRREARALLGSLLRPYRTDRRAARHRGRGGKRCTPFGSAARPTRYRLRHSADHRRRFGAHADGHRRRAVRCRAGPGRQSDVLPAPLGTHRADGAVGTAAAGVPAFPAPRHRLPRPLHVGPGGEPVHQRRRRDRGNARDRLRQPHHRGAHPHRHRDSACRAGCSARPDVSGCLPDSGGAGVVVQQRVGEDVPGGPRERRAGHRAVRRDDDRHQGRPGVPARAP